MNELRFFNPYADIRQTENRLPHWQQEGAVYFITFRLADAVPLKLRNQWENDRQVWLRLHPEPWNSEVEREYHNRFSGAIEQWLDAGHGACLLRRREFAEIVAQTLRHFEGERVVMISFVIMPNHVHALFVQNPMWPLEKLLQSWKRFTTREINKLLDRAGNLWQRDYFDRLVRDEKHFANCVRYIRRNPEKARLTQDEFLLWESEIAKAIA
ncbi:MAG TPA: transposase [Chthoniobacterales bacterium]|nr:transposase [Chthoniobacterales bacterium]